MPVDLSHFYTSLIQDYDLRPGLPSNPPGNYLARELRHIHDDSQSVFPESKYSDPDGTCKRWKSLYHSDFIPIEELAAQDDTKREAQGRPKGIKEKGVADKMFMNWKVPSRLTDECGSERGPSSERAVTSMSKRENLQSSNSLMRREKTMPALVKPAKDAKPGKKAKQAKRKQKAPPSNSIPLKLPQIVSASPRIDYRPSASRGHQTRLSLRGSMTRGYSSLEPQPTSPKKEEEKPASPMKERLASPPKPRKPKGPKGYRSNELLKTYYQPGNGEQIEEMVQRATDSERQMMEQALKLTAGGAVKQSSGEGLEKWLKTANPQERAVALNFFRSLVGAKLVGGDNSNQESQDKIKSLEESLERGKKSAFEFLPYSNDPIEEDRFRYIRILTPKTRRDKWMHQTWHHLPNYRDDNPVTNRTSIYTEPHKIVSRHFTIHPDWGS